MTLEAASFNDDLGGSSEKDSVTLEDNGLSDCAPQESPVAEAGPGVSYPGYKQYCRWTKWPDFQIIFSEIHFQIITFSTGPASFGSRGNVVV